MNNDTLHAFYNTKIDGGFWRQKQDLIENTTIHAVWNRFSDTGRMDAFKCDWQEGMPNKPHIFWDSDVAKWMESAAYILEYKQDPELEAKVDGLVDLIAENQWKDGYFNIYYDTVSPSKRFTDIKHHELYCAGHLMEAAVAYYHATGKDKFLKCMCRYADLIERIFTKDKSAKFEVPGHEEIELALVKLYHATGEKRYLDLSKHFIDKRGTEDDLQYHVESDGPEYFQRHLPVREQKVAAGHAVRACYLYSGMADIAKEYNDKELYEACHALFQNIVNEQMYITGGIGSSHYREAFSMSYDLPNMHAYNETCAALSLALFARRMALMDADSIYADTVERVLYNGFLSGLSLDGKSFFYENPLEFEKRLQTRPAVKDKYQHMPITKRVEVFFCSCCPPNVTRFIESVADFLYSYNKDRVYVHQFMESHTDIEGLKLIQKTDFPKSGNVLLETESANRETLMVRVPYWCPAYTVTVDGKPISPNVVKGYAEIPLSAGKHTVAYNMEMPIVAMEANPMVQEDAGRVAIMRGPLVYCLESVDNGTQLRDVAVKLPLQAELLWDNDLGAYKIVTNGTRRDQKTFQNALYRPFATSETEQKLTFIPYYAFANRDTDEMIVWIQYRV